jgi:DNA-binding Lrp family transcriptional regulator
LPGSAAYVTMRAASGVHCERRTQASDVHYLLRIVCEGLAAYQRLYDEKLATLPGVQRLTSTLVMKEVVPERLLLDQRPPR